MSLRVERGRAGVYHRRPDIECERHTTKGETCLVAYARGYVSEPELLTCAACVWLLMTAIEWVAAQDIQWADRFWAAVRAAESVEHVPADIEPDGTAGGAS